MDAAGRALLEEALDRRAVAEHAQQLDLGVGQLDEDGRTPCSGWSAIGETRGAQRRRDTAAPRPRCRGRRSPHGSAGRSWRRSSSLERRQRLGAQPGDLHLDDRAALARQVQRLPHGGARRPRGRARRPCTASSSRSSIASVTALAHARRARSAEALELDGTQGRQLRAAPGRCPPRRARGPTRIVPWLISRRRVRNRSSPAPTRPSASSTIRPTGTSSTTSAGAGGQAHDVAVLDQQAPAARPSCLRQALVGVQVARLAVDRHGDLRPDPAVHLLELVAAGVARDVDEMVLLGDHLDALTDQQIVQVEQRALVAGDDLGAEDRRVAGLELDPRVLAAGDAHQGRCGPRPGCRCTGRAPARAAGARPRARRGPAACP